MVTEDRDLPTLGSSLRAIRKRLGWTLREMSEKSGIAASSLSKIEHDRLTLTYDRLVALARRLGVPISEFFAEAGVQEASAVTARRSLGHRDRAIRVTTDNYDYRYLCPELRRKRMIPILTHIRARTVEAFGEFARHAGEEYIYVLKGAIEVHTEFYDPVVLEQDESIYIDSSMAHAYIVAAGHEEATVLGVCASVGDGDGLMTSLIDWCGGREEASAGGRQLVFPPASEEALSRYHMVLPR